MPISDLYDISAFGACGGTGTSRSGDVVLTPGEGLRIVVGHDGFEGDAAFAGGGQRQRVYGRGGECGKGSPGWRPRDQREEVQAWTST